jgi:hypothetical protein
MKRCFLFAVFVASCASGSQPVGRQAPLPPASASPSSAASAPVRESSSSPPPASQAAPVLEQPQAPAVSFETPYKLGARPRVSDEELAEREQRALAAWNRGGREGKWHPEPRVMIDNVKVRGRIADAIVLRETRKLHYWPIRKCYDPALAANQQLHGKLHIQVTIRHNGSTHGAKSIGKPTLDDAACVSCIVKSFSGLKFPATTRGDATVTLDIGLNPGDLPMSPPEEGPPDPGPGLLDPHVAQAVVAGTAGHQVQRCYQQGLERVPSLWGRLALRAELDPAGAVTALIESESTFPDPATTSCVIDAVRKIVFPAPKGGGLKLVIPFRFGRGPND